MARKIKLFNRECSFVKVLNDFEKYKNDYAIEIVKSGANLDYTIKSLIQPTKRRTIAKEEKKEA